MSVRGAAVTRLGAIGILVLSAWCGIAATPAWADNTCKPAAPAPQSKCKKDAQCCAGLVCEGGRCGEGCRIDGTFRATGTVNAQCESCQPTVSTTSWTPRPDGTNCDDSVACTQDDFCFEGACEHGVETCPTAACNVSRCNLETGACELDPVECRTPQNECFQTTCQGTTGICITTCAFAECSTGPSGFGECAEAYDCFSDADCEDDNQCTNDRCDLSTRLCSNAPVSCNDGNPQTFDYCDPKLACVNRVLNPCEDGIACTQDGWDSVNDACANTPLDERCRSDDPCLVGVCDPAAGGCRFESVCD